MASVRYTMLVLPQSTGPKKVNNTAQIVYNRYQWVKHIYDKGSDKMDPGKTHTTYPKYSSVAPSQLCFNRGIYPKFQISPNLKPQRISDSVNTFQKLIYAPQKIP